MRTITGTSVPNPIANLIDSFSNAKTAANAFNNHFTSVFVNSNNDTHIGDNGIDWDIYITAKSVECAILKHSLRKSAGSDGLPIILYHYIADVISVPLAHIYNLSIGMSVFPNRWKHSHIIPIPKCKSPTVNDLRPISLLNFCGKIFETLVYSQMKHTLFPLFGDHQFGFREHCSTTTALIALHDHATRYLDCPAVSGIQIFSLDYAKAFDKLHYDIIVKSLVDCHLSSCFIKWIASYLTNRTQSTRVFNTLSSTTDITSGVPQGSLLGPALLNIVLGSLKPIHSDTGMVKYADDINLSVPIYYSGNNVTAEINNVIDFSTNKGLTLNFSKCNYLFISFKSNCSPILVDNINAQKHVKILGVYFSNDLTWDYHFDKLIKRANQRFYAVRILRHFLSAKELTLVYYSMIRSLLEYCSPLFIGLNKRNCAKLDRIQNRFHYFICNKSTDCDCDTLEDLCNRRKIAAVNLYNKISSKPFHILQATFPKITRKQFIQPFSRTTRRLNSFIPCTTAIVNSTIT